MAALQAFELPGERAEVELDVLHRALPPRAAPLAAATSTPRVDALPGRRAARRRLAFGGVRRLISTLSLNS